MDKKEVFEDVNVTEELDSECTEMDVTTPESIRNQAQEDNVERPKKPR